VWHYIKQELSWEIYENLDALKEKVRTYIEEFSLLTIASITGWDYILSALDTVAQLWISGITMTVFLNSSGAPDFCFSLTGRGTFNLLLSRYLAH
jgi:hypothetical protein